MPTPRDRRKWFTGCAYAHFPFNTESLTINITVPPDVSIPGLEYSQIKELAESAANQAQHQVRAAKGEDYTQTGCKFFISANRDEELFLGCRLDYKYRVAKRQRK